jgi:hypothetical protein
VVPGDDAIPAPGFEPRTVPPELGETAEATASCLGSETLGAAVIGD